MRLLLDTNIVIMLAEGGERLPNAYAKLLTDERVIGFVSAVSLWELSIKYRLGKLKLNISPQAIFELLPSWRAGVYWLNPEHAIADADLTRDVKDPFDRMFVTIAEQEGMKFLTTDRSLLDHPLAWRP